MKSVIVVSVFGVLGFNEDGNLIEKALFPKDACKAAEKLIKIESGRVIDELVEVVGHLKTRGFTPIVLEHPAVAQALKEIMNAEISIESPSEIGEKIRDGLESLAIELGFARDPQELREWIHSVSTEISRSKVRLAAEKRDQIIVQAIETIDELDRTINLFLSRIREWYGLHFPELSRIVENHVTYLKIIQEIGKREGINIERLEKLGIQKRNAQEIVKASMESMGSDLLDADILQIRSLSGQILQLLDVRSNLEDYLERIMNEAAPNLSTLTGPTLGARLIALAGGLENLAKMPASTIQVLGAEKALFRALTSGTRPPKHGIIFQHNLIHGASRWLRGKIARTFAGKIAIAARTDAFGGNYIGDKLKLELTERIEEIKKKYPQPRVKEGRIKRKSDKSKGRIGKTASKVKG
ncbi:MAG: C/D box methylation guide ribonucleoprotein complex aNOP56 subunit [Nitrososphaerota archaeon]|nr:C/D box methylation guide ribonucleoprotein complex aNOP56 subunit [Candidatus Bathyarchaeota archaeon]MDW8048310.1 C/D box methylation guide ribonucleoprotein complex aNOP56 subunit [Nitrososphaerota archaeon]